MSIYPRKKTESENRDFDGNVAKPQLKDDWSILSKGLCLLDPL